MILALLLLQIAATDSVYTSQALRRLVDEASRHNRIVPVALQSYRAEVESEIAILARRPEGIEGAVSIEQTQSEVRWQRTGEFEQHVSGYRSQSIGLSISMLSVLRTAWTVPILYGNRMSLLFGRDTSRRSGRGAVAARRVTAVHPLAEDRDQVYRFSGGDTVVTMRVGNRTIPVVRVFVEPRMDTSHLSAAFRGELDLDATRRQLIRMRGHFVTDMRRSSALARVVMVGGFQAIAFVELENAEVDGAYWLPVYQRVEAQAMWSSLTDGRSIFRMVSRFRDHRVNEVTAVAVADTLVPRLHRLTLASTDTLSGFAAWRQDLGVATSAVHSDDFDDVAPDRWRPVGAPRLDWKAQRVMDIVHYNRVEGLFTGMGAEMRFRDAAPGLVVRTNAGWAWHERALRGRVGASWARGHATYVLRAGRTLDLTNDFRSPFDSGATLGPLLFSVDNHDYVDRRLAAVGITRVLGGQRDAILRLETGPAADRGVTVHVTRGVFRGDSAFRANRGVREGSYWRNWAVLEWHPDVNAEFMRTGVGATLLAEHAAGELSWTRLEGRVMARRNAGAWTLASRLDGGLLLGKEPPPQQLFELGQNQNLPGYDYKEFAGTHAAIARGIVMYRLPLMRAPIRLGRWFLPSPAPALAGGVQSGWTAIRGAGGASAVWELGSIELDDEIGTPTVRPISRATGGVRTTVSTGFRFFGGALGVGMARAVDRPAPWRVVIDLAQIL